MPGASYQTIMLSIGTHPGPEDGACVMELASMLTDEPFSDHPGSVCPVIGGFLRAYNDSIDDDRRQDLYAYAANVVGSRGPMDVRLARAKRLQSWAGERPKRRWARFLLPSVMRMIWSVRSPANEAIGGRAVCSIGEHNEHSHADVLALIDELLEIGRSEPAPDFVPDALPSRLEATV